MLDSCPCPISLSTFVVLFSPNLFIKKLKHLDKFKEDYNEYPYALQIDSMINILPKFSIAFSTRSIIGFHP